MEKIQEADGRSTERCNSFNCPENPRNKSIPPEMGPPTGEMCPVCSLPLVHAVIANVLVQCCTECRGMLIPMQVFLHITETLEFPEEVEPVEPWPGSSDPERKILCPRCHTRFDTHPYRGNGHTIVDSCIVCNLIWLDRGELIEITRTPDARVWTTSEWK